MLNKLKYAILHPAYLMRRLSNPFLKATRYDERQWARIVMYRELFNVMNALHPSQLCALEISPGGAWSVWREVGFREYKGVDYPDFDICSDVLDSQFDIVIADQVFEHLLWPYRAAKNAHAMVKPGGRLVVTTPFLIRVHDVPIDCSRWTELGLSHLLAEAGFDLSRIKTGSWGNRACVEANLRTESWAAVGWGRSLRNEPPFPVAVWAIAEK